MVKWEYMITSSSDKRRPYTGQQKVYLGTHKSEAQMIPIWDITFEEWLNQLGDEGWEIVAASGSGWGTRGSRDSHHQIILKKQKPSN